MHDRADRGCREKNNVVGPPHTKFSTKKNIPKIAATGISVCDSGSSRSCRQRGMRRSGSTKPRVHVVWDEQNLDFLEANKTPKQKINEPKTPYHAPEAEDAYTSGAAFIFIHGCQWPSPLASPGLGSPRLDTESILMADAQHAEAIRNALSEVAATSNNEASCSKAGGSGGWSSSDDEAEDMDHDMEDFEERRRSFEDKRRAHYDEYRKAKELVTGQELSDEDDKLSDEGQRAADVAASSDRPIPAAKEPQLSTNVGDTDLEEVEM
ncbi:hypothetical protein R1sor_012442 [Riccia sorocarpa]|uniref:Protein phosphatase inhibitor 2 n=1 Tax=Riccia sorocarpa TaxID=122646 RepID=A0ABD3I7X1_9MARC